MKLTSPAALKFFRTCISLQDEFYNRQIVQNRLFEPILNIVYETMPRDNLLNSACLELFEFIKKENIKPLLVHLVQCYRKKLEGITYVDTFQTLVLRYDQIQDYVRGQREEAQQQRQLQFQQAIAQREGVHNQLLGAQAATNEDDLTDDDDEKPRQQQRQGVIANGVNVRFQGVKEMDAREEEYFATSDDEDGPEFAPSSASIPNGTTAIKPLVDYTSDNSDSPPPSDDAMEVTTPSKRTSISSPLTPSSSTSTSTSTPTLFRSGVPPERLSEKRRREETEDEDDELVKLAGSHKRRSASVESNASVSSVGVPKNSPLRQKTSFQPVGGGDGAIVGKGKKIAISLGSAKPVVVPMKLVAAEAEKEAEAAGPTAESDAETGKKKEASVQKAKRLLSEGHAADDDDDDGGGGASSGGSSGTAGAAAPTMQREEVTI
jgi:protein phosphatase-4 regulatory subunit 3